ncbi:MAG: DNA-directed RNA polymerase subunit beta', partial [Bacilli bacterium]|nr:DNA-directed RNA polymerase subunit beta' [Bacilli bacterium]
AEVFKMFKLAETSKTLDKMKDLGFKYSTLSGITVSASDIQVIGTKEKVVADTQKLVNKIDKYYARGIITTAEKRDTVIKVWTAAKKKLEEDITQEANSNYIDNHIYLMGDSGARGNIGNFIQLSGMRGFMAKPNGESMDVPIVSSFKEGLTMAEFFISTHGARKGSTDTALKTAESGYLTRRLVDVSQDVIITEDDCHTDKGMLVKAIFDPNKSTTDPIVPLYDRIRGRYTNKPVYDPKNPEIMIADKNEFITDILAEKIVDAGVKEVYIRTLLTCNCKNGVCVKCYGSDLSTGEIVEKGEVVGVIAAQSIGEPGTQLTMRTFHSGGVAGGGDITQGLPRVQELFEAREPKGKAIISDIKGEIIKVEAIQDNRYEVIVRNKQTGDEKKYLTDSGKRPIVSIGDFVEAGQLITAGQIHPKELIKVSTVEAVENYILVEVQKVYRSQGVEIADKHIEIIIKQMLRKVVILNEGGTDLLPGSHISRTELQGIITDCIKKGIDFPIVKPILLGITRSSLKSDSFLSAASFQETTRVLTEAAIRGKKDTLEGLKENIIIGGLIPAGTGLAFADYKVNADEEYFDDDEE